MPARLCHLPERITRAAVSGSLIDRIGLKPTGIITAILIVMAEEGTFDAIFETITQFFVG